MTRPKIRPEVKYTDKPFKCGDCPKGFENASSLCRHKRTVHSDLHDEQKPQHDEEEKEEDIHVPKNHDKLIELMRDTGFDSTTAKNLAKFDLDMVQSDDEEVFTVYERNPQYHSSSDEDEGYHRRNTPKVLNRKGVAITLADPYAPPSSSSKRSSTCSTPKPSKSSRSSDAPTNNTTDAQKPNPYGRNLNSDFQFKGNPYYEPDDEDEGRDFYETHLAPKSEGLKPIISTKTIMDPHPGQDEQSAKDPDQELEQELRRDEDWEPEYEEALYHKPAVNQQEAVSKITNGSNITNVTNVTNVTNATNSMTTGNGLGQRTNSYPSLSELQIMQRKKEQDQAMTTEKTNDTNPNQNENKQHYYEGRELDANQDPVLPPLSFMIEPKALRKIAPSQPVIHMFGNVPIRCIVPEDYISCLTECLKSPIKAIVFIKNIGVAYDQVEADFRVVKKIYLEGKKKSEIPFRVLDLSRLKIEFLDNEKKWRCDLKGQVSSKIISDNLMNAFLKMNNDMIAKILGPVDSDTREALLDEYQINKTQEHAHLLSSSKWRIKLVKRIAEFIHNLSEEEVIH